jgi:NHLM bacteriocin system secretion protein
VLQESFIVSKRKIDQLARPEALSEFSSSEQLDQRLVIIGSRSWILMSLVVGAIILAVLWGFLGRVSNSVSGEGIIVGSSRPIMVSSPTASGGVIEVMVPVGKIVEQGQLIVLVHNIELEKGVSTAKKYLAILQAQDVSRTSDEKGLIEMQKASTKEQIALANKTLEQTQKLVTMYESEVADLEELYKKQLVSSSQLVQARSSHFSSMQQVVEQGSVIARAEASLESTLSSIEESQLSRLQQIETAKNSLAKTQVQHDASTQVISPIRGRIINHQVDLGSVLSPGTDVITILPVSKDEKQQGTDGVATRAVCYIPFGRGKEVKVGMKVEVSLPFAKSSRYGYIKGSVTYVSDFATGDHLSHQIGSNKLASEMTGQTGATLELELALETDSTTPSGLAWTSREGYPHPIPVLSLCSVRIILHEDRPIDLVVPWIKDMVGIDQPPVPNRSRSHK